MTDNHPITPPPELVQQWYDAARGPRCEQELATQAARWGADQELEACCRWIDVPIELDDCRPGEESKQLRAVRRPMPPSLKERALDQLDLIPTHDNEGRTVGGDVSIIRTALERLQELEDND